MYYYLFRGGVCDTLSGSETALKELAGDHTDAKIIKDDRWLNPADVYLNNKGRIAVKTYAELPPEEMPASEPPVDPERLAVYEAMAAQEERLAAYAERITALEAALKAKGGEGK